MIANSVKIESMFGWVVDTFRLFMKSPRSLLAASAITLAILLVMIVPLTAAILLAPDNLGLLLAAYAFNMLVSLILFPPLMAGWFRLLRDIDHDKAVGAFDIFKTYQDKVLRPRIYGFSLLALLAYLAVFAVFVLLFKDVFADIMVQMVEQQKAMRTGKVIAQPIFPISFYLGYLVFIGLMFLMSFIYMTSYAELALRGAGIMDAVKRASIGIFKNLFKLCLFTIVIGIVSYIALFIVMLVLILIAVVLAFIHPAIGMAVGGIFYIGILLFINPIMFGGYYFVWKSILADSSTQAINSDNTTMMI
jgi:hypothetical protein